MTILLLLLIECADVATLIHAESRFRTGAVSERGACGLLQVRPPVLRGWMGRERWTCSDLKHPLIGVVAGLHVRAYWRERAARAGKPGCWRAGWTGGNRAFRVCREK